MICPKCGSETGPDYDEVQLNKDGVAIILWFCDECHYQWDDVFEFVKRENLKIIEDWNPEDW